MSLFAYIEGVVVWARSVAELTEDQRKRYNGLYRDAAGARMKYVPQCMVRGRLRRPHFAHVEPGDGPGESLSHLLFKLAFARVKSFETGAEFKKRPLGRISVSAGVYEYPIWCDGRRKPLRVDVVLTVDKSAKYFVDRWGPIIGVEIECSNPTKDDKAGGLKASRVPCVEIKIPDEFEIEERDELSGPEMEALIAKRMDYIARVRFSARVLSDEHSVSYLEAMLEETTARLARAEKAAISLSEKVAEIKERNDDHQRRLWDVEMWKSGFLQRSWLKRVFAAK